MVGQHKSWVLAEQIYQLRIDAPSDLKIESVELKNGSTAIPKLRAQEDARNSQGRTMREDATGVCRPGTSLGFFQYDASKIRDADHVVIEISKPDSWFEHYTDQLNDDKRSPEALIAENRDSLKGDRISIDSPQLASPGYYEIRVAAVSRAGNLVGLFSDPLNVQLSLNDFKQRSATR